MELKSEEKIKSKKLKSSHLVRLHDTINLLRGCIEYTSLPNAYHAKKRSNSAKAGF